MKRSLSHLSIESSQETSTWYIAKFEKEFAETGHIITLWDDFVCGRV
jgi:hypothetical protein